MPDALETTTGTSSVPAPSGQGTGGDAGGQTPQSTPSAPASSPPSTPSSGAATQTPVTPSPGTQAAPGDPGFVSIRQAAGQYGYQFGQDINDDHAALQHLILQARRAQEANHLAQLGQQVMPHWSQFQQWQQEQARQQQAQQGKGWWTPPEYDPRWANQVIRDPNTGELRPAQGAPADVVQKYLTAVQHRDEFLEKFAFDPLGSIRPGIEEVVKEITGQMIQGSFGTYQDQVFAQNYVQQNSGWLHARDQQGNVLRDQQGQPQLSQQGRAFAHYVNEAKQLGIKTEQGLARYAEDKVRLLLALDRLQQVGAQQQGQQAKQEFQQTQTATHQPQQAALAQSQTPSPALAQNQSLSLEARLRQGFRDGGVTDQDVQRTFQPQAG